MKPNHFFDHRTATHGSDFRPSTQNLKSSEIIYLPIRRLLHIKMTIRRGCTTRPTTSTTSCGTSSSSVRCFLLVVTAAWFGRGGSFTEGALSSLPVTTASDFSSIFDLLEPPNSVPPGVLHVAAHDDDDDGDDLLIGGHRRSLAKACPKPLQCTPALYFSTLAVGPTETAHYDKFPYTSGDSTVCRQPNDSVITLGDLSEDCRQVVYNVTFELVFPSGSKQTRAEPKIQGRPFTVFGKASSGAGRGWIGRRLPLGEYFLTVSVWGEGNCVLHRRVYRFVYEDTPCLETVQPPCWTVQGLPNLPNDTRVALRNASSYQSRAYNWVLGNRRRFRLQDPRRCISEMTHVFAIYTTLLDNYHGANQFSLGSSRRDLEKQLKGCSWGATFPCIRGIGLEWRHSPRPLPMEFFLATKLEQFFATLYFVESSFPPDPTQPLIGTLPTEIARLSRLCLLYFSKADSGVVDQEGDYRKASLVAGTLPTELGLLTNLRELYIDGQAQVSESIPTEIGRMSSLEDLAIDSAAKLNCTLPKELWLLSSLTALSFRDVSLQGTIPSELGSLTKLQFLVLGANSLQGTIPSEVGGLTKLYYLDLADNLLQGTIPSEFGRLTKLRDLYLGHNSLQGVIPREFSKLQTKLRDVELHGNNITPGVLPCLSETYLRVDCRDDLNWTCQVNCTCLFQLNCNRCVRQLICGD